MPAGYVIAESIRAGSRLEGFPLTLIRIERHTIDIATGDQPSAWTMIHFDFPKDDAARLADALADVLDEPGWYTNFDVDGDKVVIFPRRVMRYRGRATASPRRLSCGPTDPPVIADATLAARWAACHLLSALASTMPSCRLC